ncbi:DedA family protein [soil metagenome]
MIFDPETFLTALGPAVLIGIAVMVFIESGVLFPFLPGDSLLFTAGLLSVSGVISVPLWLIIVVAFVAAGAGDQVGYLLGRRFGRRLFKPDARILKTRFLERAEKFFAKYGGPALLLGRFVPIVRTYVPVAAGAADYHYRRFVGWNLTGAALWSSLVTVLGALLGRIPAVRDNVDLIAIGIVVVSVVPIAISAFVHLRGDRHGKTSS